MMKLYSAPGACALAPHIALIELGLDYQLEAVDFATRATAEGRTIESINVKGKVPALVLDGGATLTESAVILAYLAERGAGLMPPAGTLLHWRVREWLNFLAAEVHKDFEPLFRPGATDGAKTDARVALGRHFAFLESQLVPECYLAGEAFGVADLYLFVLLRWATWMQIPVGPRLMALYGRVLQRPAVQQALREEGLPH